MSERPLRDQISSMEADGTIKPTTKICLLIAGKGKATGLGLAMHNGAYKAMHVDFYYIKADTDDLKSRIEEIRASKGRIVGASVTIPYKEDIMQYLDHIDERAKKIGAVNTVLNVDGKLHGYNSDWIGAEEALEQVTELRRGMSAIVAGIGGGGMAISYMLKEKGVEVTVYNRNVEKGRDASDRLGIKFGGSLDDLSSAAQADIIVNTTSIGSRVSGYEGESIIPKALLEKCTGAVAFDIVYLPRDTKFLIEAKEAGLKVVHGERMLLSQAVFQVQKFTGREEVPVDVMERELLSYLAKQA